MNKRIPYLGEGNAANRGIYTYQVKLGLGKLHNPVLNGGLAQVVVLIVKICCGMDKTR